MRPGCLVTTPLWGMGIIVGTMALIALLAVSIVTAPLIVLIDEIVEVGKGMLAPRTPRR